MEDVEGEENQKVNQGVQKDFNIFCTRRELVRSFIRDIIMSRLRRFYLHDYKANIFNLTMKIMTLSPMQHEYVTKKEFGEYKSHISHGFDKLGEQIDAAESHLGKKIDGLDKKIDSVESGLGKRIDSQKIYIDEGFEMTNKHIDNLERNMDKRFASIGRQFAEQKENMATLTKVVNKIATKVGA